MEFTRPRNEKQFIVKSQRSLGKKIVEILFSVALWEYMFLVIYFFISACLGNNGKLNKYIRDSFGVTNSNVRGFLILTVVMFIVIFVGLIAWKYYNKIKFGSLNRRSAPENTTDEEMIGLGLVNRDVYEMLQNGKVVVFENNPIKDI